MLNRRFALPALCSLGLHSALFFGFPKSVAFVPTSPVPYSPVLKPLPTDSFVEPPPLKSTNDDSMVVAKVGEGIPLSEIDIPRTPFPGAFVVEVAPKAEAGTFVGDHIPIAGSPGGSPLGDFIGEAAPKILSAGSLDRIPEARAKPAPAYPHAARQEGIGGSVEVEFVVNAAGDVVGVRVLNSTDRRFEEPTVRAVSKWRFEPGRKDGRTVPFRMRQTITFGLNE